MVIGSVLLQPQPLRRARTRDASGALMDDLVRIAFCLAKDAADGAPALLRIEGAVENVAQAMLEAKGEGIQAAVQRFARLFETLRQRIETFAAEGFDDAGDLARLLGEMLTALSGSAGQLSPDILRERVNEVFAVVSEDLGITPAFIEETVWSLFDGAILVLAQGPDGETPAQRANRREIARLLGRIKRGLRGSFRFPRINADLVADALLTLWKNLGLGEIAGRVACSGKGLATCFRAGTSLLDLIDYSASPAFGRGSLGAASTPTAREKYCWYASWLLEYQNGNGDLGTLPASLAEELFDGHVFASLRDAFRPLSVVLTRWAIVQTVTEHEKWKVIDRKKYIVKRATSEKLVVYHLFEMSSGDFLEAAAEPGKLRKEFLKNGIRLSESVSVAHEDGSNMWTIVSGPLTYRALKEGGTVTIHPQTAAGALFDVGGALIPELDRREVSSGMVLAFEIDGVPLTPQARVTVRTPQTEWLVDDGELEYAIKKSGNRLEVGMGGAGGWIQSQLTWPDGDKVWIDKAATRVMLGRRILHLGAEVKWQDAPIFKDGAARYTFKLARPDLMEHFAFHSAWSRDMQITILHLISIEKGDIASNTVNASWDLYEMILKLALHRPSSDLLGYWPNWLIPFAGTILASLEGMQTRVSPLNWFIFWFCILLGTDLGEKALYSYWMSLLRNLFLSSVTLLNQDTSAAGERPLNHGHIEPWISGFVDLSLFVLAKAIPRDRYTYPFEESEMTAGYWVGGGLGVGLVGGLLGATAAAGLARGTFAGGNYLKASLKGLIWGLVRFWPMVFLVKEGDSADGTYNPVGASFPGYPASGASSPYNLPYPAGTSVLWGQCNQGMFSHHNATSQVYAFDLAMDQGDPVLAMRPGTVANFFDGTPDDTEAGGNWNFITIRHDRDENGNLLATPINANYDRDQGGALTVTFATYGHGRQGSVTAVFAARGIAAGAIIGQPVRRGQRIMLAGDTGRSFHNHLHIHVQPALNSNRTLPIAFREIDGVPKMLNTYESQNQEVP